MASPQRIRKIETENDTRRPRDAALRRAQNDNTRVMRVITTNTAANDNNQTIDEEFNDSYAKSGIQPSINYQEPARGVNVTYKGRAEATGYKGRGSTSVNLKNPAGIPATIGSQPKAPRRLRPKVSNLLPTAGITGKIAMQAKATRVSLMFGSVGIWFWLTFQLPLAIFSLVIFGVYYTLTDLPGFQSGFLKAVGNIVEFLAGGVGALAKALFGVDLVQMGTDTLAGLFIGTGVMVFFIGFLTFLIGALMYQFSGINCLFGRGSLAKICAVIAMLTGYMLPFLNIFPWFILWALVVWRYPK